MRRVAILSLVTCAVLGALSPSIARADASSAAAAEALYEEGKKLETKGDYAGACPKFAESQKIDPAAGTLLHLANCYEKTNRGASAWVTYLDAASAARAQNRADWEKAARTKAAALEPKLPRLVINVEDPANTIVKRDDIPVNQASFGVGIPIDPGTHTITAEGPKKKPFTTAVAITGEGTSTEVKIAKLEDAPDATPPAPTTTATSTATAPPPPPPKTDEGSGRKTMGYVVGGVGIIGLGVGSVTGLMAISANNDAKKECPGTSVCANKSGVDSNNNAKTLGTVSTISFIAGGVLFAGGLVLVISAPSSGEKKSARVEVAPAFGPDSAGFLMRGSF